jgi:hypothetical protein
METAQTELTCKAGPSLSKRLRDTGMALVGILATFGFGCGGSSTTCRGPLSFVQINVQLADVPFPQADGGTAEVELQDQRITFTCGAPAAPLSEVTTGVCGGSPTSATTISLMGYGAFDILAINQITLTLHAQDGSLIYDHVVIPLEPAMVRTQHDSDQMSCSRTATARQM